MKSMVLPLHVGDTVRFALDYAPEVLKPRVVLNKHFLCRWPIPEDQRELVVTSRVNTAVAIGAYRSRGYLCLDGYLSKNFFFPLLSLTDICYLLLQKIRVNLAYIFLAQKFCLFKKKKYT